MSESCKNKYEVLSALRAVFLEGIAELNLGEGWDVFEYGQPTWQNSQRCILLKQARVRHYSWTGSEYGESDVSVDWLEEQTWTVSVVFVRRTKDGVPLQYGLSSEDVVNLFIMWFNSIGWQNLKRRGIVNIHIDDSTAMLYNDDSNVYQNRAAFSMKVQVPKEFQFSQEFLSAVEGQTLAV